MFIHPLAREDEHLIQDFMLTKIALLVARHADDREWLFELQAMDDQSRDDHGSRHAFLFIYTVARYCVAARRLSAELGEGKSPSLSEIDAFSDDFAQAIAASDCDRALGLWLSSPHSSEVSIAAPPIRRLAAVYLQHAAVPETTVNAAKVADYLPDPYISPPSSRSASG